MLSKYFNRNNEPICIFRKETVLAPLFKLLEASFELFVPLVMAAIIDHGIGQADGVYVLKMGGVVC